MGFLTVRHGEKDAAGEQLVTDEQRVALITHLGLCHGPLDELRRRDVCNEQHEVNSKGTVECFKTVIHSFN